MSFGPGEASNAPPKPRVRTSDGQDFDLDTPEGGKFLEESHMVRGLLPRYPSGTVPLSEVDGDTMRIIMDLYSGSTAEEMSRDAFLHVVHALNYLGNDALPERIKTEVSLQTVAESLDSLPENMRAFKDSICDTLVQKAKSLPLEELRSLFFPKKPRVGSNFGAPKRSLAASNPWMELCERGIDEWFDALTSARFWELASMDADTEAFFADYCKDKVTWARVCPRQPSEHADWEQFYLGLDTHGVDPAEVRVLNLRGCIFPQREGHERREYCIFYWSQRSRNGLALLRTLKFPNLQRLLLGGVEGDHHLLRYTEAPIYPPYDAHEPDRPGIAQYTFDDSVLFSPQTEVDEEEIEHRQELDDRPDDEWDDEDVRDSYHAYRAARMLDTSPYITGTLEVLGDERNSPPMRCTTEFKNAWTTRDTIGFGNNFYQVPDADKVALPARVDNTTHELGICWRSYLNYLPAGESIGGFPRPINNLPPLPQLQWLYIEKPFSHTEAFLGEARNSFLEWLITFVQAHPTLERINVMDENAFAAPNTMFLFVILRPEDQGGIQNLPGFGGIHVDNTRRGVELWRELLRVARNKLTLHYFLRRTQPVTYCTEEWREGDDLPADIPRRRQG